MSGKLREILLRLRAEQNRFFGALLFMTRLPVDKLHQYHPDQLRHSASYFPLVGALVGLVGGAVACGLSFGFGPGIAALLAMLAMVLITGGLHEDGLADAADGLLGGTLPARRLEIMKDSRLGTYGALALWFSLTAKWLLLSGLLAKGGWSTVGAMVAANALGRGSSVYLLFSCRYVSGDGSKSQMFGGRVSGAMLVQALSLPVVISFTCLPFRAVPVLLLAAGVTWAAKGYFERKIGGVTGDCLGACNQWVELVCYLALVPQLSNIQ